jgi:hypothetical protein
MISASSFFASTRSVLFGAIGKGLSGAGYQRPADKGRKRHSLVAVAEGQVFGKADSGALVP